MKKFNKDKYLKKLRFKKYKRYLYIGIPCILVLLIGIYFAYSKFSVFKEEEVVRTTVGDFISGDAVIGAYIDGEYSKSIPGKNDGYIVDKIVCDNDASASWDTDSWGIVLTNMTKRTKCNVYFKIDPIKKIIAQLDTSGKCPTINSDGTVNVTKAEATDGYVCSAADAYGTSYYYRGNVTNNYVKFGEWHVRKYFGYYSDTSRAYRRYDSLEECQNASSYNKKCAVGIDIGTPIYWRIIRMNGDGSIRVIYDGTSAHENGESSDDRQIGTSTFNNNSDDNAYVGYMYGKAGASTYAETHANINNSTIKTYIDTWYENNIKGTTNEKYIVDNIFCNDRSFSSSNSGTGTGKSSTAYNWADWHPSKISLKCPQQNDAFTVSDTIYGNGALTYSVGLLSTDEVVLAGSWNDFSGYSYLQFGNYWWTSSPAYAGDAAYVHILAGEDANYIDDSVSWPYLGVRPVLNVTKEVLQNGNGTIDNPYTLSVQ